MFDGAAGFREHDIPQTGVPRAGGPVRDGEVLAGLIAIQEYRDVVYLGGAVLWVRRQLQAAVGGHVKCYFYLFCTFHKKGGVNQVVLLPVGVTRYPVRILGMIMVYGVEN